MMGFFDRWKMDSVGADIGIDEVNSKPYLYLTMNSYGGASQDIDNIRDPLMPEIPEEVKRAVREDGGLVSVASGIDKPEESEYLDGVLCTVWASTRMEAAGAVMAFTTMSDDMMEQHLMHQVAEEVAKLELDDDQARGEERATEVYEFMKSEKGLVVGIPTASDDGEFMFSGCYVTVEAPRRTDSEAARIVVQGSNVLYASGSLPSLMSSLHLDISGVYGITIPGSGPIQDIDGDDDSDWYS